MPCNSAVNNTDGITEALNFPLSPNDGIAARDHALREECLYQNQVAVSFCFSICWF